MSEATATVLAYIIMLWMFSGPVVWILAIKEEQHHLNHWLDYVLWSTLGLTICLVAGPLPLVVRFIKWMVKS